MLKSRHWAWNKHMKTSMAYGLGLGLAEAAFGAWKDTLHEPFSFQTFVRSPIIVTAWAGALAAYFPSTPPPIVALSAVAGERLTVEGWKASIRKSPGKFNLPELDTGWLLTRTADQVGLTPALPSAFPSPV